MGTRSVGAALTLVLATLALLLSRPLPRRPARSSARSRTRAEPGPGRLRHDPVSCAAENAHRGDRCRRERTGFPGVFPGTCTVSAALSGLATIERPGVRVTLPEEQRAIDLTMGLARADNMVVASDVPAVDTTWTSGTSYEASIIAKLPLNTYYADVVRRRPGVQRDNGEVQGRSHALSVYGSTSAENVFLIDGVNTTNVVEGVQGKAINSEFVEEVEVKTGGYQAEYGRSMGGVVNAITGRGATSSTAESSAVRRRQHASEAQGRHDATLLAGRRRPGERAQSRRTPSTWGVPRWAASAQGRALVLRGLQPGPERGTDDDPQAGTSAGEEFFPKTFDGDMFGQPSRSRPRRTSRRRCSRTRRRTAALWSTYRRASTRNRTRASRRSEARTTRSARASSSGPGGS